MTNYAGESYVVTHTARNYDNTEWLTDADVTAVTLQIFDVDGGVVVDETEMTWFPDTADWRYEWITGADPSITPGSYRARVVIQGPAPDEQSFEWLRIRLGREPLDVT